jgi:60 kDa SS-A/Ro ribonucleoprotein
MSNKTLFKSAKVAPEVKLNINNWEETINEAGGAAFSFPDKLALAQFAVTGTFNNVFYTDAETQLEKVKELCKKVDSVFLTKLAIYSREKGYMKDMPAFFLAVLHSRGCNELLSIAFPRVITSFKMLANFVQIVRSGVTGRKSFGTSTRRVIRNWLAERSALDVFNGSIGLANPSVADIIKMVHPKGEDYSKDAVYAYLTEAKNWETKFDNLPEEIQLFEKLKKGENVEVPNIPFRALTNLDLNVDQWRRIASNMPFNTLRQNINMLSKRNVFKSYAAVNEAVSKLANGDLIRKIKVFPYQLFTTFQNMDDEVHVEIKNALQEAAEYATENVPSFGKKVVLAIDVSGSMQSPVTGCLYSNVATKTRCVDVAGLIAACVVRNNKNALVLAFDTSVYEANINPRDSIMTNSTKIAKYGGGGTNCSLPLDKLNRERVKADLVIYVSDNMSWQGNRFGTAEQWNIFKKNNPKAKLINIDIQPYPNAQVPDNKDVLNIGGYNDAIWPAIESFIKDSDSGDFVETIENAIVL